MKVSREKVAEHREALLATARRLLQEHGFDGAAVAEISRAAGLTQGALYGQFKSKDALAAEAIRQSFAEGTAVWEELRGRHPMPFRPSSTRIYAKRTRKSGEGLHLGGLRVGDRAAGPRDRRGICRGVPAAD